MKDQRRIEIKVGIMFMAGIIVFILILGWAKSLSFSEKGNTITIKFLNVAGLEIGDNVTVNGVREGHVENISVKDNNVFVTILLNQGIDLRSDAKFAISMTDLMGGKKVDISPGTSSQALDYSQVQQGTFYADVSSVMAMLGSSQNDLLTTIKEVKVTLKSLNNYLTDQQLNKNIKTSISNLSELTGKMNLLIDENRKSIKKLTANSVDITNDTRKFISENKGDISQSIKEAVDVLKNTDSLVVKVNDLADEIKNRNNNIGKVLYDEKIYKNLTESLQQVNELTKIIIKQLNDKGFKVDAKVNLF